MPQPYRESFKSSSNFSYFILLQLLSYFTSIIGRGWMPRPELVNASHQGIQTLNTAYTWTEFKWGYESGLTNMRILCNFQHSKNEENLSEDPFKSPTRGIADKADFLLTLSLSNTPPLPSRYLLTLSLAIKYTAGFLLLHVNAGEHDREMTTVLRHLGHSEGGCIDTTGIVHPSDEVVGSAGAVHHWEQLHPLHLVTFGLQQLHIFL